jgi:hypothetical protein
MQTMYYIVLHRTGSGHIHAEGSVSATRFDLDRWMSTLPQPWLYQAPLLWTS